MKELIHFLEYAAYQMRQWSIKMTTNAGSGHTTSALSAADIMAVLFLHTMSYDPDNFENPNNDRFILSKGHAAPILYAAWHQVGKLTEHDLMSYRDFDSTLEGHPTFRFAYTEAATGALGIGLSIGVGESLCAKMDKRNFHTYVLLGDSEVSEGAVWEAAQLASYYKLNNLIGIIDCNRLGQSTATMEALEGDEAARFEKMFDAFGWHTISVDGHNIKSLVDTFDLARKVKNKPVMIIAKTKKGFGVDLVEDKEGYHGKPLSSEQATLALEQMKKRFDKAASYQNTTLWKPHLPKKETQKKLDVKRISMKTPDYKMGDDLATRKAYGQALVALGRACHEVVSLDAEVKNSTYAELFEKEFPNRFVQCFIAEQNMVSMGVGFDRRGKLPFISTFGAFMSRAHDQIRMAAVGTATLHLVGSHAGVSIGEDGPSQMALEDIAMMRAIPDSVVLYPSDAVSTYKLVEQMARYDKGITYLRTTRMATPIRYDNGEEFVIGGCKVLKQSNDDVVCVIGAGITLVEAMKAYERLKKDNIAISVIDLYSIKPLDINTLKHVTQKSGNNALVVEDHYNQGGIAEAVSSALCNDGFRIISLAVSELPRSGKPEQLLAHAGIDADAIIKHVRALSSR